MTAPSDFYSSVAFDENGIAGAAEEKRNEHFRVTSTRGWSL
jgi:hypothetical protein